MQDRSWNFVLEQHEGDNHNYWEQDLAKLSALAVYFGMVYTFWLSR